jgi:hypothetical protein
VEIEPNPMIPKEESHRKNGKKFKSKYGKVFLLFLREIVQKRRGEGPDRVRKSKKTTTILLF